MGSPTLLDGAWHRFPKVTHLVLPVSRTAGLRGGFPVMPLLLSIPGEQRTKLYIRECGEKTL